MRNSALASLVGAFLTASIAVAQVSPGGAPANDENQNKKGVQTDVQPGKVGPGSENNAEVSPTSPTVPTYAQPPPEIPPGGSSSTGSGSGDTGSSANNPSSPGIK